MYLYLNDPTPAELQAEKIRRIFREKNLPFIATVCDGKIIIRHVPAISACYYLMNINNAA